MNTLKIVASIIIVISSSLLGIIKSRKLGEREFILRDFILFLTCIENEIKYMLTVLPNAYEIARIPLTTKLKNALGAISSDMLKSSSYDEIERSIEQNINQIDELESYDKSLITSTLKNLGTTNTDGQINLIENAIKNIENQIEEANSIKIKNSRMYRMLGCLFGIIIVVIFI